MPSQHLPIFTLRAAGEALLRVSEHGPFGSDIEQDLLCGGTPTVELSPARVAFVPPSLILPTAIPGLWSRVNETDHL